MTSLQEDYDALSKAVVKMPNGDVIRSVADFESHLAGIMQDEVNRIVIEKACLYWWQRLALRIGLAWC